MILVDRCYVLVNSWASAPSWACPKSWTAPWVCPWPLPSSWCWPPPPPGPSRCSWPTPAGSEGTTRDLGYLQTIVFILIIAILVQLLENILKKFIPALYKSLGVYLPLITTNCTILGVTILNIDNGYDFMESIVCAAGAGIGFLVAMVLFSGVRRRVEEAVTPKCFEGLPITLVSAAVTSLSFMGFGGIIESIFHV